MNYKTLLVEDDPMVVMINQRFVEALDDFKVTAKAQSLDQAKELLLTQPFDLVLIDINLKNESGLDLVKWIRDQTIPVEFIVISAANQATTVETASAYGAVDYLLKPFNAERLHQSLHHFKQKHQVLHDQDLLDQASLDSLYGQGVQGLDLDNEPLQKGISRKTLQHLMTVIRAADEPFDIEELVSKTTLSHVTIRKYIQFLVDHKVLKEETKYGSIGRPTTVYWLEI
ncbi:MULTISPECIES: response regulator [unclassified Aerococcus]|uniref:response regulator n=1 Tax=unclassified Aerococcus TaxID=2618060 RepID=UPI0025C2856E|nr:MULTISPECIES: response regulator [unclassified Aerococcus]